MVGFTSTPAPLASIMVSVVVFFGIRALGPLLPEQFGQQLARLWAPGASSADQQGFHLARSEAGDRFAAALNGGSTKGRHL